MRVCVTRLPVVMILCVGLGIACQNTGTPLPPACPATSDVLVDEVVVMIERGEYPEIQIWLARVERYCGGIDALRSSW